MWHITGIPFITYMDTNDNEALVRADLIERVCYNTAWGKTAIILTTGTTCASNDDVATLKRRMKEGRT